MTNTWKPIDTAPRDGTYILAKVTGTYTNWKAFAPAVVAWNDGKWREGEDDFSEDEWDLALWMDRPSSECGNPYVNLNDFNGCN